MPKYTLEIGGKTYDIESDKSLSDTELMGYAQRIGAPAPAPAAPPGVIPGAAPSGATIADVPRALARQTGELLGGAVRGAGTIGAALAEAERTIRPASLGGQPLETLAPRVQQRAADITAALVDLGVDPDTALFQGGKFVTEVLGSMGLGPAAGAGLRAAGLTRLGTATEMSGLGAAGAGGATGVAGMGLRTTGGAISGGAQAVPTALEQGQPAGIGTGAVIGGALPGVVRTAGAVGGVFRPLLEPTQVAEETLLKALGGQGDDAVRALQRTQGAAVTPGFTPTLSERLAGEGVATPTVAAMERRVPSLSDSENRMVYQTQRERIGALKGQLERINADLQRRATFLRPEVVADLADTRDQILRSIADEERVLNASATRLAGGLQNIDQIQIGGVLSDSVKKQFDKAQGVVSQKYQTAFELAGPKTAIDFRNVMTAASDIRKMPIVELKGLAPETAQVLELYTKQVPENLRGRARRAAQAAAEIPPQVTLEQADALGKALNIDFAALRGRTDSASNIARSNIGKMKAALDDAIMGSNLSDGAKSAYAAAKQSHATEVAERFYSGTASKLRRLGTDNRPLLPDERVTRALLGSETGARDLLNVIGRDADSLTAMRQGVEDLFRRQAVVNGRVDFKKASAFLTKNANQIRMMDDAGAGVGDALRRVQDEAATLDAGYRKLSDVAAQFKATSPDALVEKLLKEPARMQGALTRMGEDGRRAFAGNLTERVQALLRAGNPDDALALLRDPKTGAPKESMRLGLGRQQYDNLTTQAQLSSETKKLLESPQLAKIEGKMPTMLRGFTTEDLMSLERVARDIQRIKKVDDLAGFGVKTTAPDVGAMATESAAQAGISARGMPTVIDRAQTIVRNVWVNLEDRINKKAAAEIGVVMYRDPDAAIQMIRNAQARAKAGAKPSTATRAAAGAAIVGGAQVPVQE
jgi:hypothetical protein